jgi:hypothetical protein
VWKHFFLRHVFFTGQAGTNPCCFSQLTLARGVRDNGPEGGRRAEDPFRGLRAGPARSSPRLTCTDPQTSFTFRFPSVLPCPGVHSLASQGRFRVHTAGLVAGLVLMWAGGKREEDRPSCTTRRQCAGIRAAGLSGADSFTSGCKLTRHSSKAGASSEDKNQAIPENQAVQETTSFASPQVVLGARLFEGTLRRNQKSVRLFFAPQHKS